MLGLYRLATTLGSPLMPFYLKWREGKGKEEPSRRGERLGYASLARPNGALLWVHAASVGEANAALALIERLKKTKPDWHILMTTGTVTSASLMDKNLPKGVIHQFAPLDTLPAAKRFVAYWKPDMALFIESELWPNLIQKCYDYGTNLVLVNAKMSEKSFRSWNKIRASASALLNKFNAIYAQTEADTKRFHALGAQHAQLMGNIKYDGAPLEVDVSQLVALSDKTKRRTLWLAASTHPGEEIKLAETHVLLAKKMRSLLTIIVPRHPERGPEIAETLKKTHPDLAISLRSRNEKIDEQTNVYIADTLGELGLFYRLCPIVFMGGSLVKHGGQNPLEPARIGCTLLFGPHMFNFSEIAGGLKGAHAAIEVADEYELAKALKRLFSEMSESSSMAAKASAYVVGKSGVCDAIIERLLPLMEEVRHAA